MSETAKVGLVHFHSVLSISRQRRSPQTLLLLLRLFLVLSPAFHSFQAIIDQQRLACTNTQKYQKHTVHLTGSAAVQAASTAALQQGLESDQDQ